jgi:sugar phosphate isomerase/epimerase
MDIPSLPTIAISNKVFPSGQQMIDYCMENHLKGIDYTLNPDAGGVEDLQKDATSIERIIKAGLDIRYHFQFFSQDIADVNPGRAKKSQMFHKECVAFVSHFKAAYATIHIGLGMESVDELNYETALNHLSELVTFGEEKNVVVCLENLTKGWTNHPDGFLDIVEKTNARITFDIGHANACPWVVNGRGTGVDFLHRIASRVINAHIYEIEKIDRSTGRPYHAVPENLDFIGPLLSALARTRCDWWLIELTSQEDVHHTRSLLQAFLTERLWEIKAPKEMMQ